MTAFIDSSVIMYASGADHPMRSPCGRIMSAIADGRLEAVTSVEVVQEIVHRYLSIGRAAGGLLVAEQTMDTFAPVLPVTHALMRRVPDLARRYPRLQARDLVHVATCIHEGITEIITTDLGFDEVAELRRIAPEAFVAPG